VSCLLGSAWFSVVVASGIGSWTGPASFIPSEEIYLGNIDHRPAYFWCAVGRLS
jgi:hypothetical protein